jgi:hypothetical protein
MQDKLIWGIKTAHFVPVFGVETCTGLCLPDENPFFELKSSLESIRVRKCVVPTYVLTLMKPTPRRA